jgi:AraC-like DNA-binding protein
MPSTLPVPPFSPPSIQAVDISLLENLFDEMPDVAFFIKDKEGCYLAINQSLVERHGLQHKSQVRGKRPCDICPGEFGQIPSQQDKVVLHLGRPLHDHLELHWYAPNQPCWCLTTKLPMLDSAGKIVGLIGISRDIRAPIKTQEIPIGVADVLEQFEKNVADPVTPTSLAAAANISSSRFARLMKRFFGLTPSQYIAKHRIAVASILLVETDLSVSEIALASGYYDHSAFTRAFRKLAGISPTQFRETKQTQKLNGQT